jgi:hypothetical protein
MTYSNARHHHITCEMLWKLMADFFLCDAFQQIGCGRRTKQEERERERGDRIIKIQQIKLMEVVKARPLEGDNLL